MAVTVEPFPDPLSLSLTDNPALTTGMSTLAADPGLKDLCAAVVDLNGAPAYAGFNDDDMLYIGSMQKICAMYAAFELRSRIRQHVAGAIADGLATDKAGWHLPVIKDLETAWQPKLTARFPKKLPAGFPKLNEVFTFAIGGGVDFSTNGESQTALDHRETKDGPDGIAHGDLTGLRFRELLGQMMRWSNNQAAGRCVLLLSYPYLNGVLNGAGFFDPGSSASPPGGQGLWMSGNYAKSDWLKDDAAGVALSPRWAKTQDRKVTNFAADARQVARLLTLLAVDQLVTDPVNSDVNQEIRGMMSGAHGIGSYLAAALRKGGRSFDEVLSKIGWGNDTRRHDCGIVEKTASSAKKRYVVVGLGGPNDKVALSKLFVEIDKLI